MSDYEGCFINGLIVRNYKKKGIFAYRFFCKATKTR